jgi:outer membrane protein assembly factor BamB
MRRAAVAGVVVVGLIGCSDGPEEPEGLLTLEGSPPTFEVERAGTGKCEFDYRAQLSRLSLETGEEQSVTEVPYPGEGVAVLTVDSVVVRSADYPSDPPSVFAVSAADGRPIWQREIEDSFGFVGAPQQAGELVVTLDGSSVVALRLADGEEAWRRPAGQEPLVTSEGSDVAVAKPERGEVEMLDATSGEPRWTVSPGIDVGGSTGIALTPGVVVTGGQSDDLVGLDRASGEVRWTSAAVVGRYRYGLLGAEGAGVIVRDVASNDPQAPPEDDASYLWSIDPDSGTTNWRIPVDTEGIDSTVLLGSLVLAPHAGSVEAIEVATGEVRWTFPITDVSRVSAPSPDLVVIATGFYERGTTEIHAIDAISGETRFTASLPVASTGPVAATGDLLLIGGGVGQDSELVDSEQDGFVFALSAVDGSEEWRAERRDAVNTPVIASDGTAIVLSADPGIFCD